MPNVLARWEIRSGDGRSIIRGDLRAPRGPAPRSAVILCHGFKGFKDWGFFPVLARALVQRGHAVLSFNGSRSGVEDGGTELTDLDRFAENTHTRMVGEIRAVIDAACGGGLFPRTPQRLGLFGHSRGGGEAILAAAADPRIAALVTWAAVSTFERWTQADIDTWTRGESVFVENKRTGQQLPIGPGYWSDLSAHRGELDITRAARGLAIPWLIAHGEADETVPTDNAFTLLEAAGSRAELLLIPGAGHTFGAVHPFTEATPELRRAATATLDWFDRHLRPSGA